MNITIYRCPKTGALSEDKIKGFRVFGTYGPLIPWFGGDCPVPPHTLIMAYFRDRRPYPGKAIWDGMPKHAQAVMWQHAPCGSRHDPAADIVGYRLRIE